MESSKKNTIMVIVIVACLVVAGIITYAASSRETGFKSVKRGTLTWLKCRNPDCEGEHQMDKRDYFETIDKEIEKHPTLMATPPLVCPECGP